MAWRRRFSDVIYFQDSLLAAAWLLEDDNRDAHQCASAEPGQSMLRRTATAAWLAGTQAPGLAALLLLAATVSLLTGHWAMLGVGTLLTLLAATMLAAAGAVALLLVALLLRALPCHPQDSAALRYNAGTVQDTVGLIWERCFM